MKTIKIAANTLIIMLILLCSCVILRKKDMAKAFRNIDPDPKTYCLTVKAKISRVDNEIVAHTKVSADYGYLCARCLEDFHAVHENEYYFNFEVSPEIEYIDVGEEIRQEFILANPARVLCKDDCKGICSGCGTNLNLEKYYWQPNMQVDGLAFIAWTVVTPAKTPVKTVKPTSANKTRRKNTASATTLETITYPLSQPHKLTPLRINLSVRWLL